MYDYLLTARILQYVTDQPAKDQTFPDGVYSGIPIPDALVGIALACRTGPVVTTETPVEEMSEGDRADWLVSVTDGFVAQNCGCRLDAAVRPSVSTSGKPPWATSPKGGARLVEFYRQGSWVPREDFDLGGGPFYAEYWIEFEAHRVASPV